MGRDTDTRKTPLIDGLVSPDLAGGEWIEHVESGAALVITVHCQTINSLNTGQGLQIVREALTRLRNRYGDRIAWRSTVELCEMVGV